MGGDLPMDEKEGVLVMEHIETEECVGIIRGLVRDERERESSKICGRLITPH
jgi:hypothetical protein